MVEFATRRKIDGRSSRTFHGRGSMSTFCTELPGRSFPSMIPLPLLLPRLPSPDSRRVIARALARLRKSEVR